MPGTSSSVPPVPLRHLGELIWRNPGRPYKKDKTFFFASYEGFRLRQDIVSQATVPLPAFRNGDFSALPTTIFRPGTRTPYAGNVIPQNEIDPAGRAAELLSKSDTTHARGIGSYEQLRIQRDQARNHG